MRYRLSGVWRSTELEGVIFLEAATPEEAAAEAQRMGLDVKKVTGLGASGSGAESADPKDEPPTEDVTEQ